MQCFMNCVCLMFNLFQINGQQILSLLFVDHFEIDLTGNEYYFPLVITPNETTCIGCGGDLIFGVDTSKGDRKSKTKDGIKITKRSGAFALCFTYENGSLPCKILSKKCKS